MDNKKVSIAFFGDNCADLYQEPTEMVYVGGNAINTAVHAKETGIQVSYLGSVGTDRYGSAIIKAMQDRDIDVVHVQTFEGDTAWTKVTFENGERVFAEEFLGPASNYIMTDEILDYLTDHDVIHNTWQGETVKYLPLFKEMGKAKVSLDFGERYSEEFLEECIPYVDIAFFSTDPDNADTAKEFGEKMLEKGPEQVIVTMGKNGALYLNQQGDFVQVEANKIEAIDTLGAGDTFIGTFLGNYVLGKSIKECMKNATDAAAGNCQIFGGFKDCRII